MHARSTLRAAFPFVLATAALLAAPSARAQACGSVIITSTVLTQDIVCPPTAMAGLIVRGHGVVLDLGGHSITMATSFATPVGVPGAAGVLVEAAERVLVANGRIVNHGKQPGFEGVRFASSAAGTASGLWIAGRGTGVVVSASPETTIIDSTLQTDVGIQFTAFAPSPSHGTRIVDNRMRGILSPASRFVSIVDRAARVEIRGNHADHVLFGIEAPNVRDLQVLHNRLLAPPPEAASARYGVLAYDAVGGTLEGNLVSGFGIGIALSSQYALVSGNEVVGNGGAGPGIAIGGVFNLVSPAPAYVGSTITANGVAGYATGLQFYARAQYNDARGNTWGATTSPVIDLGRGNRY